MDDLPVAMYMIAWVLTLHWYGSLQALDVKPQDEKYLPDYSVYHNLSSIRSHLEAIVNQHPGYMKLNWVYKSREQHPQMLLHITNFTDGHMASVSDAVPFSKVHILLSYGEHAREFLPVESLFHLLTKLSTGLAAPKGDPDAIFTRMVLSEIDLSIVALLNPDGRKYVETNQNYCWRGTGNGVDLNRNFDWNFGQRGSSGNKDDEEFRGTDPFSEPECQILLDLTSRTKFDAFISLHSGTQQIYIPYADSKSKSNGRKPENYQSMLELADVMSRASPLAFPYGQAYTLNEYTADGTIFDYMAGVRQIPFSFAIELWGEGDSQNARCFDLFNPQSQDLQKALQDIHPMYEALFTYLVDWKSKQLHNLYHVYDPVQDAPSLAFGFILLASVILVTLVIAIRYRLYLRLHLCQRRRVVSLRSLSSTFVLMQ